MRPEDAIERVSDELARRPRLRIAAVSGPGEPLANRDTFVLFDGLQRLGKELEFCLSTNGALLSESVGQLQDLGINAVSVSMNAITPEAAARIYEWAVLDGDRLTGVAMGEELIRKQLEGIQAARGIGIHVKVNTVLIPAVNDREIDPLSRSLKMAGAELHNIVPLIPNGDLSEVPRPTSDEIAAARRTSSTYMRQLLSCAQCRSDVVGIPGHDTLL
jgi:nitrogen fixation protein NifB